MITVLMTDENGFYFFYVQFQPLHSLFCFPATQSCINEHRFAAVANIIAIGITAAVE